MDDKSFNEWVTLFPLNRGIPVTCCLRFTYGATSTDLLTPSIAAEPFSSYLREALVGLETGIYCATDECSTD